VRTGSTTCSRPPRRQTTGKIERFHRTLRSEFLTGRTFASLEEAHAELDGSVASYS
jgi:transposase InsO family protein